MLSSESSMSPGTEFKKLKGKAELMFMRNIIVQVLEKSPVLEIGKSGGRGQVLF